jgi:hypothetical protein
VTASTISSCSDCERLRHGLAEAVEALATTEEQHRGEPAGAEKTLLLLLAATDAEAAALALISHLRRVHFSPEDEARIVADCRRAGGQLLLPADGFG